MPKYLVEAPDGRKFYFDGEGVPTESDLQQAFSAFGAAQPRREPRNDVERMALASQQAGPSGSPERAKAMDAMRSEIAKENFKDQSLLDKSLAGMSNLSRGLASAVPSGLRFLANVAGSSAGYGPGFGPRTAESSKMVADWVNRSDEQKLKDLKESPLWKAGESAQALTDRIYPQTAGSEQSFVFGDVPSAVGSFAASIGAGVLAGPFAGAAVGTMLEAMDAFDSELARQEREGEAPDPDKAWGKGLAYSAVAMPIEYGLGVGRLVKNVYKRFGRKAATEFGKDVAKDGVEIGLKKFLVGRAKDFGANYTQEGLQQLAQDLIVEGRADIAGAHRAGLSGGVAGTLFGGGLSLANRAAAERDAFLGEPALQPDTELNAALGADPVQLLDTNPKPVSTQYGFLTGGLPLDPEELESSIAASKNAQLRRSIGQRVMADEAASEQYLVDRMASGREQARRSRLDQVIAEGVRQWNETDRTNPDDAIVAQVEFERNQLAQAMAAGREQAARERKPDAMPPAQPVNPIDLPYIVADLIGRMPEGPLRDSYAKQLRNQKWGELAKKLNLTLDPGATRLPDAFIARQPQIEAAQRADAASNPQKRAPQQPPALLQGSPQQGLPLIQANETKEEGLSQIATPFAGAVRERRVYSALPGEQPRPAAQPNATQAASPAPPVQAPPAAAAPKATRKMRKESVAVGAVPPAPPAPSQPAVEQKPPPAPQQDFGPEVGYLSARRQEARATQEPDLTPQEAAVLQLVEDMYFVGALDGKWNPASESAVSSIHVPRASSLTATGSLRPILDSLVRKGRVAKVLASGIRRKEVTNYIPAEARQGQIKAMAAAANAGTYDPYAIRTVAPEVIAEPLTPPAQAEVEVEAQPQTQPTPAPAPQPKPSAPPAPPSNPTEEAAKSMDLRQFVAWAAENRKDLDSEMAVTMMWRSYRRKHGLPVSTETKWNQSAATTSPPRVEPAKPKASRKLRSDTVPVAEAKPQPKPATTISRRVEVDMDDVDAALEEAERRGLIGGPAPEVAPDDTPEVIVQPTEAPKERKLADMTPEELWARQQRISRKRLRTVVTKQAKENEEEAEAPKVGYISYSPQPVERKPTDQDTFGTAPTVPGLVSRLLKKGWTYDSIRLMSAREALQFVGSWSPNVTPEQEELWLAARKTFLKGKDPETGADLKEKPRFVAAGTSRNIARNTLVGQTFGDVRESMPVVSGAPNPLDVRGSNQSIMERAAAFLKSVYGQRVTAPDGVTVQIRNSRLSTIVQYLQHLIFNNKTRSLDVSKAEALPLLRWTLENATIRLHDPETGNRIYVAKVGGRVGTHMVVVRPDGEVEYQGALKSGQVVTQFDYGSAGRQDGFAVEWENAGQLRQNALPTTPAGLPVSGPRAQGQPNVGQLRQNALTTTPAGSTASGPRQQAFQSDATTTTELSQAGGIGSPVDAVVTAALAEIHNEAERLGARIILDPNLGVPAQAAIDDNGVITIFYNPENLAKLPEAGIRAALAEEIIHVGGYVALLQQWQAQGRPGTLVDFINAQLDAIHAEMSPEARLQVADTYFSDKDELAAMPTEAAARAIAAEYLRMLVQKARTGTITEAEVQGMGARIKAWLASIADFLKRMVDGGAGPIVAQAYADINRVLNFVEAGGRVEAGLIQMSNATMTAGPTMVTIGGGASEADARAYHGTPHRIIDRFSTEKIGSGEGAQVYGWGLYFAQNRAVAHEYAVRLAGGEDVVVDGKRYPADFSIRTPIGFAAGALSAYAGKIDQAIKVADGHHKEQGLLANTIKDPISKGEAERLSETWAEAAEILRQWATRGAEMAPRGNIYTVEIDVTDDQLLPWDEVLPQSTINHIVDNLPTPRWVTTKMGTEQWQREKEALKSTSRQSPQITGRVLYERLSKDSHMGPKKASEHLWSLGYMGIKYFDQGSRAWSPPVVKDGDGWSVSHEGKTKVFSDYKDARLYADSLRTYNYVIFDDSVIRITEDNGKPVTPQRVVANASRNYGRQAEVVSAKNQPGLTAAQQQDIQSIADVQVSPFEDTISNRIKGRMMGVARGVADRVWRRWMNRIDSLLQVSYNPQPLSSIAPSLRDDAAMRIVYEDDFIQNRLIQAQSAAMSLGAQLTEAASAQNIARMNLAEVQAEMLNRLANETVTGYSRYLDSLVLNGRPGETLSAQAALLLRNAASNAERHVVPPAMLRKVLQQIADNPSVDVAGLTPEQVVANVRAAGGLNLTPAELAMLPIVIGDPATGLAPSGLIPMLQRVRNLGNVVQALRDINTDAAGVAADIAQFQADWPKGAKVSLRDMANRFHRTKTQASRALTIYRSISRNIDTITQRLDGTIQAINDMMDLTSTPQYQAAVREALLHTATVQLLVDSKGHYFTITGPRTGEKYAIQLKPTREVEQQNRDTLTNLLAEIDDFLKNGNPTPLQRVSWERMAEMISRQWLTPTYDGVNYTQWNPKSVMGYIRTRQGAVEQIATRAARSVANHMMQFNRLTARMRKVSANSTYGDNAQSILVDKAMDAHGYTRRNPEHVTQYERDVLNPLLASYQSFGQPTRKVGDTLPSGMKVLPEDMALARAQYEHDQAVRAEVEDRGAEYIDPVRITENLQAGNARISRRAIANGAMVVPRGLQQWATRLARNWLDNLNNFRATIIQEMFTDPELFRDLLLGYVVETNPEFGRNSKYEREFREIERGIANGTITISEWSDLVAHVARINGASPSVVEQDLRSTLEAEVAAYIQSFADANAKDVDIKDLDNFLKFQIVSLDADGSFVKARGRMLAPSTFYRYGRADSPTRMALRANAMHAVRTQAFKSMRELVASLKQLREQLQGEADRLTVRGTTPRQIRSLMRQRQKAGEIRYTLAQLDSVIPVLESELGKAETVATRAAEEIMRGGREFIDQFGRAVFSAVLSAPKAVINNLIGGTYGAQLMLDAHLHGAKHIFLSRLANTTAGYAKWAVGDVVRIMEKIPRLKRLSRNTPLVSATLKWAHEWADMNARMIQRLRNEGLQVDYDAANRFKAEFSGGLRGVGLGGMVYSQYNKPSTLWHFTVRPAKLYNQLLTQWVFEPFFPRIFDYAANVVNAHYTMQKMLFLQSWAKRIGDTRGGPSKLDANDPAQKIAPEEMELTAAQMHWWREYLSPVGTLEAILFDYYRRLEAAPADKKAEVPLLEDESKIEAVIRSFGQRMNVIADSNAPSTFKLSEEWKAIGVFKNYPSNMLDQFIKDVPIHGNSDDKLKELAAFITFILLLVIGSIASHEGATEANEILTNRQSAMPRLANVVDDLTSKDAIRYTGLSMGAMLPFSNTIIDRMFGGGSSRPMLDLTGMVLHLQFAKDLAGAIHKVAQSGDVVRPTLDLVNRYYGVANTIVNRLPVATDDQASRNTQRVLRAATPLGVEMREVSGGGNVNANPTTRFLRQAETAAYGGDLTGAEAALNRAQQYYVDEQGVSPADAAARVRQQISARSPMMRVYGRNLTEGERETVYGRMTSKQRATLDRGERAYRDLMQLAARGAGGGRRSSRLRRTARRPVRRLRRL